MIWHVASMGRVIIDCDGVLNMFCDQILRACGSSLTMADITEWEIMNFLNEQQKESFLMLALCREFWRATPVMPQAQSGVGLLLDAQHEVICATSPWDTCVGWGYERREWLKKHFGFHKHDIVIGGRKDFLQGDAIIDDKFEHVEKWAEANPDGIACLFDAPYNQSFDWPHRIHWAPRDGSVHGIGYLLSALRDRESA
jgi:5'(3')-deoxyribonucleotidase